MPKFCGNCGTQLPDDAKICGNCGMPTGSEASIQFANRAVVDPSKQAKKKKSIKIGAALLAVGVAIVIIINVILGSTGHAYVVKKFVKAVEKYDIDTLMDMSSDIILDYIDITDYADLSTLEEAYKDFANDILDEFEDAVGPKYKISYDVTNAYTLTARHIDALIQKMMINTELDEIKEFKAIKLEITATSGKETSSRSISLILSKEGGNWKLFYIDDMRY